MKKVKIGKFSFNDPVWATMTDNAKDFITALLTKDQDKRPSAEQALEHPWIAQAIQKEKDAVIEGDIAKNALSNLSNFNASSKLK